jgi:FixJ family two-component response regulator
VGAVGGPAKGQILTGHSLVAVIDDDVSMRTALVGLVQSLGHQVRDFVSAEAFLEAGELRSFGCIVSDIQMPGMSGIDLKRHLTAHNVVTPVIMVTAHAETGLRERALASGAFCFIRKPFEPDFLVDCLDRALELRS